MKEWMTKARIEHGMIYQSAWIFKPMPGPKFKAKLDGDALPALP
jgi:hypothetical protein